MVRLNLSTMPSDWGCKPVVRVCRWRVFYNVSCKLPNRSSSLDQSAVVEGPRIGRSSVELEPLQQSKPLGRK
ncbi:hypothetical protein TNCV_5084071 [Trichonephila clavipes]|nr:hypothetical protein TNCV_5084071 [Trichonephila clavipes]